MPKSSCIIISIIILYYYYISIIVSLVTKTSSFLFFHEEGLGDLLFKLKIFTSFKIKKMRFYCNLDIYSNLCFHFCL